MMADPHDRGLEPINQLAREWHQVTALLASDVVTGSTRSYLRRLKELEAELDSWWLKRRKWLALAYNRTLPTCLLVQRFDSLRERLQPVHIQPMA